MLLHHPLSESLFRRFSQASLPIQVTAGPFGGRGARGTEDIFQMDIRRDPPRLGSQERFLIWPGHPGNQVEVEGIDRRLRQLVLMVHEPRRRFEVYSPGTAVPQGAKVIRRDRRGMWLEQWTPDRKRHFLCGVDEQHLFAAQLPRPVSAVRAAHEVLKPPHVSSAERRAGEAAIRQGEWFFLPIPFDKQGRFDEELRTRRRFVSRKQGIAQAAGLSRRGRPHVADEVFVIPGPPQEIYVRGAVRHPDHATLVFRDWYRAWANLETFEAVAGLRWFD
jgi:hypothetical protein